MSAMTAFCDMIYKMFEITKLKYTLLTLISQYLSSVEITDALLYRVTIYS